MIIWFSLVWASLIFGGRVDGSPSAMHKKQSQSVQLPSFNTTFNEGNPFVSLNQPSTIHYTIETQNTIQSLSIFLCQTSASSPNDIINSTNTYQVVELFSNICVNGDDHTCPVQRGGLPGPVDADKSIGSTFDLSPAASFNTEHNPDNLSNFFLCFAQITTPAPICDSYSPVFDLIDPVQSQTSSAPVNTRVFSSSISVISTDPVISVLNSAVSNDAGSITTSAPSSPSTSYVYVSTPTGTTYVATTTIMPTASAASVAGASTSHSKGGLSTGALVGIIVGAVGGCLILALLGLLCLRRGKRTRSNTVDSHGSAPEHVLLTQPYSSFGSRDLIAEKDSPTTLASILESPLSRPALPQNPRHSYDSLNASAPYSGLAAAVPKRKQAPPPPVAQNIHQRSLLSRGISDASTSGPLRRGLSDASGPISPHSTVREEGEDFEEYHDVPIYRDARHTPTLYESHPSTPHLQAPFLSEEGMSAEEIARLEEEERRIDAAIAEAEAERR